MEFRLASAAFVVVLATYLFLGAMGVPDRGDIGARDAAYNLLARGLLSGHLSLDKEAPPALARLADPYDPAANVSVRTAPGNRLHDFSYFHGRLYLYFGVAPALLVFIPWHVFTGGWVSHWGAVAFLCTAGLLVNLSLAWEARRRAFPGSRPGTMAALTLLLGLASYAPLLLARADMWEVPIACSAFAVAVALRCLWTVFERPGASAGALALASAAMGAAFASRPNVLPCAAILLLPFLAPENRRSALSWAAALGPLALCGAGVALYNAGRFGSPFDFGMRYQLAGAYVARLHAFSPGYVATNLRLYLLQPVRWSAVFPFAHEPPAPVVPPNHGGTEHISGALLNAPILWAALAVPAFLRSRRPGGAVPLIAASAAWVALASLGVLSFFFGACSRYQFEFVPALALLAALGVMALENAWGAAFAARARWVWIPALLVSSAFPVLYAIDRCAVDRSYAGLRCLMESDLPGAEREFATARFLSGGEPLHRLGTGLLFLTRGRPAQAQAVFEAMVRDYPDDPRGHFGLGNTLSMEGRRVESIAQLKEAVRLDPGNPSFEAALGAELGRAK